MDIFFADSLMLIKTLVRKKFPSCKILIELFQRRNQSSLYSFLFQKSFNAHDTLDDVLAEQKHFLSHGYTFRRKL